jgi:large subunit ribosomal protein L13
LGFAVIGGELVIAPGKESLFMRTFVPSAKSADSRWHVIDAKGQVLGRVATLAARLLQGKHKATYTPFIDTGDHVVVVNAAEVKLTGRKEDQKLYRYHSGFEGGLREERAAVVRKKKPFAACCPKRRWEMRCTGS